MTEPKYSNLRDLIKFEEGLRLKPYHCSRGKLTIGYGRNLEDRGISDFEANMLLSNDLPEFRRQVTNAFLWFNLIDVVRQDVVVAMCFQMGLEAVKEFKGMIEALRFHNYAKAAAEMLDSHWAKVDSPVRAARMAKMMLTGKYPG